MASAQALADALEKMENIATSMHNLLNAPNNRDTLGGGADGDARVTATLAALADNTALTTARQGLSAIAVQRDQATTITPMSAIYELTAAHNNATSGDLPNMRDYRIEDFKGDREKCKDMYYCLDWIQRALNICKRLNKNHVAALGFLRQHCIQDAGRTVANAITDSKDLTQTVVDLEINYSGLMHPDLAMEACKVMSRKEGEAIRTFGERVRFMAEMATRNRGGDTVEAAKQLATDNFMAAIRPSIKHDLRARLETRRRMGEARASFNSIVAEAHNLDETRMANDKIYRQRKNGGSSVRRINEDSNSDNSDDEDEDETINYVSGKKDPAWRPQRQQDKFLPKPQANKWKTHKNYNAQIKMLEQFEQFDDDGQFVNVMMIPAAERGGVRLNVKDLNIGPHECARCGLAGHRADGPDRAKCPLRMHIIRTEPCSACNKGGHEPSNCPRTVNLEKN